MNRRLVAAFAASSAMVAAAPATGFAAPGPSLLLARLAYGYDSNLLDASDGDLAAFASQDPNSFFVVNSMHDEFIAGSLYGQWRLAPKSRARPSLELRLERKQYLGNPICSEARIGLRSRARVGRRARLDFGLDFTPQSYSKHRRDYNALPGEPAFRPEVYRAWASDLGWTQNLGSGSSIRIGFEGWLRNYRAPFDARSRDLAGANAGLEHSLTSQIGMGITGGYRHTWSQNTPGLPTDLSNREWFFQPSIYAGSKSLLLTLRVGAELAWRHYTSQDPADHSHFGRNDRRSDLEIELTRSLVRSVAADVHYVRRWWHSNIPQAAFDEDAFSDTEVRGGLVWSWDRSKESTP